MSYHESVPESPNMDETEQKTTDEESALVLLSRDEMIDDDLYEQLLEDDEMEKSEVKGSIEEEENREIAEEQTQENLETSTLNNSWFSLKIFITLPKLE